MKVIYEDNHCLVLEKPVNVVMQEDSSKDIDLLTMAKQYIKEKYNKPNDVFLGLVHRLDRPVGGVCVIARTSKAASRLSDSIRRKQFDKRYHAVVTSTSLPKEGTLVHSLLKNEKENKVYVVKDGTSNSKKAILHYKVISQKDNLSLVEVELETGRPHQIRVQFAAINAPLWGDQKYNNKSVVGQQIALWSYSLAFEHPTLKEKMTFTCREPKNYPWSLFEEVL